MPRGFAADFAVLVRGVLVAGVAAAFDAVFVPLALVAAAFVVFAADPVAVAFAAVVVAAVDFAAVARVAAGFSASLFADVAAFVVAIR